MADSDRDDESPEDEARERERLAAWSRTRDPETFALLEGLGVNDGWRCLEVGGGSGSVARWLARRAAPAGIVISTDVDLRFHEPAEGVLEVREHDIATDPLPEDAFDLVHARGVLELVPERERALARMVAAAGRGGWVVVEDMDFTPFEQQDLPEPFGTVSRAVLQRDARARGRDPRFGGQLLGLLRRHGLEELDAAGRCWMMRAGEDGAEWWVKTLERDGPRAAAEGACTPRQVGEAVAQARESGFAVLSPLAVAALGRRPA